MPEPSSPSAAPANRGRPVLAIAFIAAALVVGMWSPWFLDYDEAVYAAVARNMWTSGDWLHPRFNGESFYEKPVAFYWLVAAAYKLIGFSPLAPRLISALALLATMWLVASEVTRCSSRETGEVAVWTTGAALLPFTLGRLGLFDALLTAAAAGSLLALRRGVLDGGPRQRVALLGAGYVLAGVTLAVKGPAFPLLIGAILCFDALARRDFWPTLRRSGLAWGLPLLLFVGTPWYVLVAFSDGPQFLARFLGHDNLQRVLTPMQGHRGSPLYYLAVLAVGWLPFTAFIPAALVRLRGTIDRTAPLRRFAAIWGITVLVAFSLVATKLPNYLAPVGPAFGALIAFELTRDVSRAGRLAWRLTVAGCVVFALVVAAVPFVLQNVVAWGGERVLRAAPELAHAPAGAWPTVGFLAAAVLLAVGAVASWRLAERRESVRGVRLLGMAAASSWAILWVAAGTLLTTLTIAPLLRLSRIASEALPQDAPLVLVQLNHRVTPNLATGRRIVFLRADRDAHVARLRELLASGQPTRVIIPEPWWDALRRDVGGHELSRDTAYVLVGNEGPRPAPVLTSNGTMMPGPPRSENQCTPSSTMSS